MPKEKLRLITIYSWQYSRFCQDVQKGHCLTKEEAEEKIPKDSRVQERYSSVSKVEAIAIGENIFLLGNQICDLNTTPSRVRQDD